MTVFPEKRISFELEQSDYKPAFAEGYSWFATWL